MTSAGEKTIVVASSDQPLSIAASTADASTRFSDLPFVPSIDGNGTVLFYGAADDDHAGVYLASRSDSNMSSWKHNAELTLADKVEGQSLVYIGFGPGAFDRVTG